MTKWRNIHAVPREAAQYSSYAEITHEGMTGQETTKGTSGSQAGHKTTAHQGKRGKPGNGRCEWEEWKPQVKQAGHMGCPSPKRVASARTCLKTDWRERSGRDNLQGKTGPTMGQSEEKRPRGNTTTDFQGRKHCCRGRGVLWFSVFMDNRSNSNRQKLQQGQWAKMQAKHSMVCGISVSQGL